jgi:hypothetical protein
MQHIQRLLWLLLLFNEDFLFSLSISLSQAFCAKDLLGRSVGIGSYDL